MNENETKQNPDNQPESAPTAAGNESATTATDSQGVTETVSTKKNFTGIVVAVVIAALILLGVLYFMEREGRIATGVFDSLQTEQSAGAVVATVNGEDISNEELSTSIAQFSQMAQAQGVDTATEESQTEIRSQALDVLINTELLRQEAVERGITISDEVTAERLATIESDVGGAEVLSERMTSLGIDEAQLESDIRDELMIQELLDTVFVEADVAVTEEEVTSVYENASAQGGEELPPLEEVREQIEAQVAASKEQELVDEFIAELKAEADIQIVS